ncbi:MAG: GLUG motif-containing protein [Candidatus Cloacimonadia bacterium]
MKTKVLLLLLMSVFVFSTVLFADPEPRDDGKYEISSWNDLKWLANTPGVWDQDFVQTGPIDADETSDPSKWPNGWTPIGSTTTSFTGTYDGGANTINNLYLSNTDHGSNGGRDGFFGYITNATIKNLGLINVDITSNAFHVGALVGNAAQKSSIENCFATGLVTSEGNNTMYTGGLFGNLYITGTLVEGKIVQNCYSAVKVTHNSERTVEGKNIPAVGGFTGNIGNRVNIKYWYS